MLKRIAGVIRRFAGRVEAETVTVSATGKSEIAGLTDTSKPPMSAHGRAFAETRVFDPNAKDGVGVEKSLAATRQFTSEEIPTELPSTVGMDHGKPKQFRTIRTPRDVRGAVEEIAATQTSLRGSEQIMPFHGSGAQWERTAEMPLEPLGSITAVPEPKATWKTEAAPAPQVSTVNHQGGIIERYMDTKTGGDALVRSVSQPPFAGR